MWFFKKKKVVPELNYEESVDAYIQGLLLGGQNVGNKENVRDDRDDN